MSVARPLLLLFLALPFIEIALFIVIGGEIGVWMTLLWLLVAAGLGGALIARTGRKARADLRRTLNRGLAPDEGIGNHVIRLIAGLLLIVPGFLTDALAALLLLPPVSGFLRRSLARSASFTFSSMDMRTGNRRRDDGVVDLDPDDFSREADRSTRREPSGFTRLPDRDGL